MCLVFNKDDYTKTKAYKHLIHETRMYQTRVVFYSCDENVTPIEYIHEMPPYGEPTLIGINPLLNKVKHGWCTTFNQEQKATEGWYSYGKKQGIHRVYKHQYPPINGQPSNTFPAQLRTNEHYVDDILVHRTEYNNDGSVLMCYDVLNNQAHGFATLPQLNVTQLYIRGVVVIQDVKKELGIDPTNITETDQFTLRALGL